MDKTITILNLIYVLAAFFAAIVPLTTALIASIRAKRHAKTESENAKAENEMTAALNGFIQNAEELYKNVNDILKERGESAGAQKKDCVMTKLQAFAISHNYIFDAEYWSQKIDTIVDLTKNVNK